MDHLAYLTAIYMLGTRYHSGQWSRGYRLSCLAQERARREHSATDLGWELKKISERKVKKIFRPEFIKAVAYYLKKLRHWRSEL